jgi:hypothetical protein
MSRGLTTNCEDWPNLDSTPVEWTNPSQEDNHGPKNDAIDPLGVKHRVREKSRMREKHGR